MIARTNSVYQWASQQVVAAAKTAVAGQSSALALISDGMALADAIVEGTRSSLGDVGMEVVALESANFSVSSDDLEALRSARG